MKLRLVQYSPVWEDKIKNMKKIRGMLDDDCIGSLIVMPEMTLTGFTMKASANSEKLFGETFKFYSDLATDYQSYVVGGVIEQEDDKLFNSLLCVDPDGNINSVYRKIHPFSYSSENKFYSAGEHPSTADIRGIRAGLSVCYDLRFPELYRFYGKERNEIIINIANWPETRIAHWRTLLKARAIENQCFMIGVNRTGTDPKLKYTGFSSVFDPMGNEIITLDSDEAVIRCEIDPAYVKEVRKNLPFLEDMVLI